MSENAGTFVALHLRLLNEGTPRGAVIPRALEYGWIARNPFGEVFDTGSGEHFSVTPAGVAAAQEVAA